MIDYSSSKMIDCFLFSFFDSYNHEFRNLNENFNNNAFIFELDNIFFLPNESISKKEKNIEIIIDNSILKKKVGRKKVTNDNRLHTKLSKDNVERKIQIHYIKFLRNLVNLLIKKIVDKNMEFYSLNHKFISNIIKKDLDNPRNKSIGDILKNNISPIYKRKETKNHNIEVYNLVTSQSEVIKNIFKKPFLEFINLYYYNQKTLNLSKYGSKKTIIIKEDIGSYEDLIKSIKSSSDYEIYKKNIESIIKRKFVSNKNIFNICNYNNQII